MNKEKIISAILKKRILWKKHLIQRLAERKIKQNSVINVLLKGDCIMEYPDDYPFPSGLFLGWQDEKPIHVVASYDENNDCIHIITCYEPSSEIFEQDYKTRKKI